MESFAPISISVCAVLKLYCRRSRERLEDLDALIHHFVSVYSKSYNKMVSVSSEAISALKDYSWPGNIRELRNVIETAVLLADDHSLLVSAHFRLENTGSESVDEDRYIDEMEKSFILKTLEKNRFNRTLAAQELNISRKTLYNKIQEVFAGIIICRAYPVLPRLGSLPSMVGTI